MTGRRAEAQRSWAALIGLYRHSDKWAGLSLRYRQDLEPVFAYLNGKIGTADVSRLTQPDIYEAMEANRHRIRFANYIPTAVSMLSKLAIRKRWRLDNPAIGIEPLAMPKAKRKPHLPWTDWAVEKMRAQGDPLARLIFEIGVGSVQRPGDWIGFTRGDYDGDTLKSLSGDDRIARQSLTLGFSACLATKPGSTFVGHAQAAPEQDGPAP